MYCLRSKQDKYDFFDDYFDWLRMFEPKIADYKTGNYDGDKLIAEIKEQTPNYQPYSKGKDFADEEGYQFIRIIKGTYRKAFGIG